MLVGNTLPADPFETTRRVDIVSGPVLLRPIRPGDEPALLAFFRDRLSPRSQYLFCPHDPSNAQRCLEQFAERIRRHGERCDRSSGDGCAVGPQERLAAARSRSSRPQPIATAPASQISPARAASPSA